MAGITTGPMAGNTVLVTGGTGGIGKATAIGPAASGVPFLVEEVLAAPRLPGSFRESGRGFPPWPVRRGCCWRPPQDSAVISTGGCSDR
jgi:hypothetical protein